MKKYETAGVLEVVTYKISEIKDLAEYDFCVTLYNHTEKIAMPEDIYSEALEQVNQGANYHITDEDDPLNKIRSWIDCLRFLKRHFTEAFYVRAGEGVIGFEYHLQKRWVDVIIATDVSLTVLEFKSGRSDDVLKIQSYLKQLKRYYNFIRRGNKEVAKRLNADGFSLDQYLVFTNPYMVNRVIDSPKILTEANFENCIGQICGRIDQESFASILDCSKYIDPSISGALAAVIGTGIVSYVEKNNENVQLCSKILKEVLGKQERTLGIIFVKGGPGSGKTGTAFTLLEKCLAEKITKIQYVTGNNNLEKYFTGIVEQTIEKIKSGEINNMLFDKLVDEGAIDSIEGFAEKVIGHINTLYSPHQLCDRYVAKDRSAKEPEISDQVLLVDEAQRLWNALNIAVRQKKVRGQYISEFTEEEQHFIYSNELSEAYQILLGALQGVINQNENKCIVLFIGSGQEINIGEEDGEKDIIESICRLKKYIDKRNMQVNLELYVPDRKTEVIFLKNNITCASAEDYKGLTLQTNQRNDEGDPRLEIVASILRNSSDCVGPQVGFEVTDQFEHARMVVVPETNTDEKGISESYGVCVDSYDVTSSDRSFAFQGNTFLDMKDQFVDFFYKKGSNRLDTYASQFGCQGLELDDCIMIWGDTLTWDKNKQEWSIYEKKDPGEKNRYGSIFMHVRSANNLIGWRNQKYNLNIPRLNYDVIREQFIFNAYRVLLSRARDTTYIVVEDEATREHLMQVLGKNLL